MIRFDLPETSHVKLVVYNVDGQKVATLIDETLAPGSYQQRWNAADGQGNELAAGVYYLRLVSGNFEKTIKALLIK